MPALRGCHTFGKTMIEAKKNIREAIAAYLEACAKLGETIPIKALRIAGKSILSLLRRNLRIVVKILISFCFFVIHLAYNCIETRFTYAIHIEREEDGNYSVSVPS